MKLRIAGILSVLLATSYGQSHGGKSLLDGAVDDRGDAAGSAAERGQEAKGMIDSNGNDGDSSSSSPDAAATHDARTNAAVDVGDDAAGAVIGDGKDAGYRGGSLRKK